LISKIFIHGEYVIFETKHKGFTIIELITIICLISILATYVMLTPISPHIALDSFVQRLSGDIRYAQMLAMTQSKRYGFVLLPTSSVLADNNYNAVATPSGTGLYNFPAGYQITGIGGGISNFVTYDYLGRPYVTATNNQTQTPLVTTGLIQVTGPSGEIMLILINPFTGSVTNQ
jgi:type II secretory pathway pseudopilin PulG